MNDAACPWCPPRLPVVRSATRDCECYCAPRTGDGHPREPDLAPRLARCIDAPGCDGRSHGIECNNALHTDAHSARSEPTTGVPVVTDHLCPECHQGKHQNCTRQAWDDVTDGLTECLCVCRCTDHMTSVERALHKRPGPATTPDRAYQESSQDDYYDGRDL